MARVARWAQWSMLLLLAVYVLIGNHAWIGRMLVAVRPGVLLEELPVGGLTRPELEALVRAIAAERDRPARDAGIDRESGAVIPDQPGLRVDVATTVAAVLAAPRGTRVEVVTATVPARHTASDVAGLTRTLGAYATVISGSPERRHNISLATRMLNLTLLYPGQTLSFNVAIGPVTAANGFRDAPVIVGEELVPGVGGGICQVSTTLFNAAVAAGLDVLERHTHSQPVSYVPPGQDATVAQYYKDLKVRNTTGSLVLIRGGSDGHRVWFVLQGPRQQP